MDIAAILELIGKGVAVASNLLSAGKSALPALEAVTALVTGAQAGTITDDQLTQTEALLDGMIADFNLPM